MNASVIPVSSRFRVDPAITTRMRNAQERWAARPVSERLQYIRKLRHALPGMQTAFAEALQADIHKPLGETIAAELLPVAGACRFLEKRAHGILKPRSVSWRDVPVWLMGEKDIVMRRPRGLVGIIGTWNYPLYLNGAQIVHALAAGNGVIWKPSEIAPRTAQVMTDWFRQCDISDDLVHVLPAEREWGPAVAEADIDYVVFTGHDTTGRRLATRLGERLIPSTLELSGHDACLVLPDANLDLTSRGIYFGVTVNAGQTCVAARRIFVPKNLLGDIEQKLLKLHEKNASSRPLAMSSQPTLIKRLVEQAQSRGGKVLIPAQGNLEDAVQSLVILSQVRPDMEICKEALFAPVAMLIPYQDVNDAIQGIRQSDYGLAMSIFTQDRQQARTIAAQLPCGLVTVNDIVAAVGHPATPFGGVGRSGWGVTHGPEGLLEMTVPQVFSYRTNSWRPHFDPMGSSPVTNDEVLSQMLRWDHSPTFWQRTKSLFGMIGATRRAMKKK
ncbi:MAG: aldehyde dehydrogenase family protein [Planctomycetia bacterium]|nr:aldehyde dehydrogenase family protein [Planctomycetia bacterium]